MKHEILSGNAVTLVSKFYCVLFSSKKKKERKKKIVITEYLSYSIYYSKNKNKKNSRPKRIWMKPWLKNKNKKSAHANIFSEFPLTEKFRHCLRMNATSYYWPYTEFYTSINYTLYITYTYNYEICIHYFFIYWFLKFTTVHVYKIIFTK